MKNNLLAISVFSVYDYPMAQLLPVYKRLCRFEAWALVRELSASCHPNLSLIPDGCNVIRVYRTQNPNLTLLFYLPDINECQLNLDNCEQVCVNLVPGFQCDCNAGLTLLISDGVSCVRKYYLVMICLYTPIWLSYLDLHYLDTFIIQEPS